MFNDTVHGETVKTFKTFEEAQKYWDENAEIDTCIAGQMWDVLNDEIIWEFPDSDSESDF